MHGFLDTARSWDWIATILSEQRPDLMVVALDFRGHGNTEWAPSGAYYHFYDYVADLADLVRALPCETLTMVGHSMGGNVATYFAGAFPEVVTRLALLESLVVPDSDPNVGPERMRKWIDALRSEPRRRTRVMPSKADVASRLKITMSRLDDECALYLAGHAAKAVEGGYKWRFDPLHRTRSPSPYRWDRIRPFLHKLSCPVLAVEGAHTPAQTALLAERYTEIPNVRSEIVADSGHALHVEAPKEVAALLLDFMAG